MEYAMVDWNGLAERATGMSDAALRGAIKDASLAAKAAWDLERAGNAVSKSQGYYHDEISVFRTELSRRGLV